MHSSPPPGSSTHTFLNVAHVFVANMSGNLVVMGMAIGEHEWNAGAHHAGERLIVYPAVVLAALVIAYVIGAAVASVGRFERRVVVAPGRGSRLDGVRREWADPVRDLMVSS